MDSISGNLGYYNFLMTVEAERLEMLPACHRRTATLLSPQRLTLQLRREPRTASMDF